MAFNVHLHHRLEEPHIDIKKIPEWADAGEADTFIKEAEKLGRKAYKFKIDQSRVENVPSLMNYVEKQMGHVDVLVNNAGICPFRDFFDIDVGLFETVMKVNVESHYFITQAVARNMIAAGIRGRILLASSGGTMTVLPQDPEVSILF